MLTFREVETAAYCPRKLYYRQKDSDDRPPPTAVEAVRDLAFHYPRLLDDVEALEEAPIAVTPTQYRSRLGRAKARFDAWETLCDPDGRDVRLASGTCRGVAHKLLAGPSVSLVFTGQPPDRGVWHPQSVRLVAAARALASQRDAHVDRVYAEYPAYGVVRAVDVNRRRLGAYRAAVRTARAIDGPPARTDERSKCAACEYRERCGVRTRSLRTVLSG